MRCRSSPLRWLPILAGWLLAALIGSPARLAAQDRVIGPGHEAMVLALFEPHGLGDEVAAGYALWNVSIEPTRIEVMLRAEDAREATLTLTDVHGASEGAPRTRSFAIAAGGAAGAEAEAAQRALISAIRRNDEGGFWSRAEAPPRIDEHPEAPSGLRRALMWSRSEWTPLDGVVVIALVYLLGLLLAWRLLRGERWWMSVGLGAVVVSGALIRAALAPATFLGAWPWSRLYPHIRQVAQGDLIEVMAEHAGHPFFLPDVSMWTNFAYAAAMPLVLFAHGTYLLRDARAGLAASFAVAFLPQHIRFSRCEDGFVASLVLTSLAFALIHGWLRDRSKVVRWLLLLALPFALYPGYLLRPLNIMFVVVYAAAILWLHRETSPAWRRALALVVVLGVGAVATVELVRESAEVIGATTTNWEWPLRAIFVLVSPVHLVLTDPTRTPPVLLVLAVVGAVMSWRAGEKRLVVFLCGWLLLFVFTHAVVVQASMQPRYHLHLVVPFLLLVGSAVPHLASRWPRWRVWIALGVALMVLSPLLYVAFIRDVGYTETREYAFVRRARDEIEEGCTVIEPTGGNPAAPDLRFSRIGALVGDERSERFRVIGVFPDGSTLPGQPALSEVLEAPPRCLYLYEGLACVTHRREGEQRAGYCGELRERLRAETVSETWAPVRFYDESNAGEQPIEAAQIRFRLSRARVGEDGPHR